LGLTDNLFGLNGLFIENNVESLFVAIPGVLSCDNLPHSIQT